MAKSRVNGKGREQAALDQLFVRASASWEEGKLTSAFRLFLAGAKAGDYGARLNLGTFYADGIGVKRNRPKALYWYRLAGDGAAARNIGVVYREQNKLSQALAWFERAVKLKDLDANLDIAQIHAQRGDRARALPYLRRVLRAKPLQVTEASREEAEGLLKRLGE
jgi:TPR repeat protein